MPTDLYKLFMDLLHTAYTSLGTLEIEENNNDAIDRNSRADVDGLLPGIAPR